MRTALKQFIPLLLAVCASVHAQPRTDVRVVGVTDGDTITVIDAKRQQLKVRLAGIDAPEKTQDFGNRAKQNLSRLVFGKTVTLESRKVDRYGRLVGKVLIGQTDANLEQIKAGLAWHYREYASEQSVTDRLAYSNAEARARSSRLGLWSLTNPVPPWDFRSSPRTTIRTIPAPVFISPPATAGQIIGNRNSMIYHAPGCPSYDKVSPKNRVYFKTAQDAQRAGYRAARNC